MFVREDCTHVHSATDVCVCVCVDVASPYEDILFCACFRTLRKIFFLHDHFYIVKTSFFLYVWNNISMLIAAQLYTCVPKCTDTHSHTHTHVSQHERPGIGIVKALLWNVSEACWSTDPQRQTDSFLLLQTQVLSRLQRIVPYGLKGYIFLTSKATAVKAPQESLFRVKGGKPFNSRTASGFWSVHKLQFYRGTFFSCKWEIFKHCAEIHLFRMYLNR